MNIKQRLNRALQKRWEQNERARWKYGVLGRRNANGTVTIVVAERPDFVYVTMDTGTLSQALNKGSGAVPLRALLPVRMRDVNGVLLVDGENISGILEGDANAPGAVYSVNGQTGDVTLNSDNIAEGATNLYFTAAEETKLAGIAEGAEINVNADWNAASGDAMILNKPTIPANLGDLGDVSTAGAIADNLLGFDGSGWLPVVAPTGGGTTTTYIRALERIADAPPTSPHASNDEFDDGALNAAWTQVGPGGVITATYLESTDGKLNIHVPARTNWGADAIVKTAPVGDFTMTTCITGMTGMRVNWNLPALILLMQGDHTLPVHVFGLVTATPAYYVMRGTSLSVLAASIATPTAEFTLPIYLKFERVGTVWNFYTSGNGHSWARIHTMTEAWTISKIGIGSSPENASYAVGASFEWVRFNWTPETVFPTSTLVAPEIHAAPEKTTPVDADELTLADSAVGWSLKKLTWANLKTALKSYLDGFYVALTGAQTVAGVKTFSNGIVVNSTTSSVLEVARTTTGTALLYASAAFKAISSGIMADGFGTGFFFRAQDSDGIENNLALLGGIRDGADNTGRFRLFVYLLGVAQQVLDITSKGWMGIGTTVTEPQGIVHAHDGTGGELFVTKTGVVGTLITIIPDGAGDVVRGVTIRGVAYSTAGPTTSEVDLFVLVGASTSFSPGAAGTLTFSVTAGGALTVQRTAGTGTWELSILCIWR